MSGKSEEFVNVMDKFIDSKLFQVHTILPGKIIEYYGHQERKAKIQPLVNPRDQQNDVIKLKPIDDVPIVFCSTNNFNMLYPLKKDDGVLILFSESSLGNFLNNTNSASVEADDQNRFDLGDAIAIPGLWNFKKLPEPPDNDNDFFLKFQDTQIQIVDNTNEIIIKDKSENTIKTTSDGITLEDKNNNKIVSNAVGWNINNGNAEVLL